jgi:hypothetical protein
LKKLPLFFIYKGYAVEQVFEALHYKPVAFSMPDKAIGIPAALRAWSQLSLFTEMSTRLIQPWV